MSYGFSVGFRVFVALHGCLAGIRRLQVVSRDVLESLMRFHGRYKVSGGFKSFNGSQGVSRDLQWFEGVRGGSRGVSGEFHMASGGFHGVLLDVKVYDGGINGD